MMTTIMTISGKWTPEALLKTFVDFVLDTPMEELEKSMKSDIEDEEDGSSVGTFRGFYCYVNKTECIFFTICMLEEKDATKLQVAVGFSAPFLTIRLDRKTKGLKVLDGSLCGIKESRMSEVIDKLKNLFNIQKKRKKLFGIF